MTRNFDSFFNFTKYFLSFINRIDIYFFIREYSNLVSKFKPEFIKYISKKYDPNIKIIFLTVCDIEKVN